FPCRRLFSDSSGSCRPVYIRKILCHFLTVRSLSAQSAAPTGRTLPVASRRCYWFGLPLSSRHLHNARSSPGTSCRLCALLSPFFLSDHSCARSPRQRYSWICCD